MKAIAQNKQIQQLYIFKMKNNHVGRGQTFGTPGFLSVESSRQQSNRPESKRDLNKKTQQQNQAQSQPMPKPLKKFKNSFHPQQFAEDEFTKSKNEHVFEEELVLVDPNSIDNRAYLTFNPSLMHRMYEREGTMHKLQKQHKKLTHQIETLSKMLSQLIDKKNQTLSQYESYVKQRKIYSKLLKNLEQELDDYQFMLSGDYPVKLQEETQQSRKRIPQLKKEIHQLNKELAAPKIKDQAEYKEQLSKIQKEIFDIQMQIDTTVASTKKKEEKNDQNNKKIEMKKREMKKMDLRQAEIELILDQELNYLNEGQKDSQSIFQYYDELLVKSNRLKKIIQSTSHAKNVEYHKKIKDIKAIDKNIKQTNEQITKIETKNNEKRKELSKIQNAKNAKRKTSASYSLKTPSNTSFVTSLYDYEPRSHIKTEFQSYTPSLSFNQYDADRAELAQRKKRVYKQLQKNLYFKNIENSQIQKKSRIKTNSSAHSYTIDERQSQNQESTMSLKKINHKHKHKSRLPQINEFGIPNLTKNDILIQSTKHVKRQQNPTQQNTKQERKYINRSTQKRTPSIKKVINAHNQQIKQLRSRRLNCLNSYQQICNRLNKDRLLIEEDCEYDMKDLIYQSRY